LRECGDTTMTITFGFGEAIELLKYGKFTLLSLYGEISKEDAVKITSIPMTEPPAVEAVYGVKEGWVVLTERYNFGSSSRPNKVYYEIWNEPGEIRKKIPMTIENIGFYCGAKIRESNIENRCTHILCGGEIHVKFWNCSDPPEDVVYDFACWYYTYRIRYHDEVMRVMRRTPMAIEEIAAILRKEGEIP